MEQSSYDSCIRNNQLMNLCWNELTVKLQRLLTGVNNLNHVLRDRDIFTLTDWRTQTQKAISGYSIAVVLVWNQTNHVQTQSAVLPSQKVLSLSFFLLKKKKKWCIDCVHLHLPSKVFHPSFCHLVNGVYPNCLGAPSPSPFAVGFTGGAQQLSPQSSFCPLTGTICCSSSVLK